MFEATSWCRGLLESIQAAFEYLPIEFRVPARQRFVKEIPHQQRIRARRRRYG